MPTNRGQGIRDMSIILGTVWAGSLGFWVLWYKMVLVKASRSDKVWGPRWLATLASRALKRFACFWMDFRHGTEDALSKGVWSSGRQYMSVWHPHGCYTVAAFAFLSNHFAENYPVKDQFVVIADLLFCIPGLAEFLLLCNARSSNSTTFNKLLENGYQVAVQPGGLPEQAQTNPGRETVFFPARLGFIRLALKHGTPLLPIYAFGENQLYLGPEWLQRLNYWLFKKTGVGMTFTIPPVLPVFGRHIRLHWGNPVEVGPPDATPSEDKVMEVYKKYVNELKLLFDTHKNECLPADVAALGLEVVHRIKSSANPASTPKSALKSNM